MKTKKYDKWTVSEHLRNITERSSGDDGQRRMWAANSQRPSLTEYWLCWDGFKCHVLTGKRGEDILTEFAAELNSERYEPRFEDGKIYMDLTAGQKLKLAEASSPPLPFSEVIPVVA